MTAPNDDSEHSFYNIEDSESQEAHSIRILQVETCRGLACHSCGIFVNFVSDSAMHEFGRVSILHMEDCPGASMLQPT